MNDHYQVFRVAGELLGRLRARASIAMRRLRGKWRLWLGFCPLCNSDAPELYTCPVCEYYSGHYPPPEQLKREWRERFENELYVPQGYREFISDLRDVLNENEGGKSDG